MLIKQQQIQNHQYIMKTIKISKKQAGVPDSSTTHLTIRQIKQKLVNSIVHATNKVQNINKITIPIRQKNIQKWINQIDSDTQQTADTLFKQMIEDYGRILTQCIDIVVNSVMHSMKSYRQGQIVYKIKSDYRKKITLQRPTDKKQDIFSEQKDGDLEIKQIFQLKERNKKLQKKILIISNQFKLLKANYEREIDKYRQMLNNSVGNLINNIQQINSKKTNTEIHSQATKQDLIPNSYTDANILPNHNTINRPIKRYLSDHSLGIH